MRVLLCTLAGLGLLIAAPSSALAKVNIFACAPEWAALASEVGGQNLEIYTASTANQDVHHMRAKPSLLAAMRKADLVICSGASLEVGWLPILLHKVGDASVQYGDIGSIMASDYIDLIEVMHNVDRSMGHVHPEGNPHIHLDPRNIPQIAAIIAERLSLLDSDNSAAYAGNLRTFQGKWAASMRLWSEQAISLKGQNVVVYHKSWAYLLNWLGMKDVVSLEPKPGIPPTASHLEKVLQEVQGKDILGILVAPFENDKAARWLASKADIPIIELPFTVNGNKQATDLTSLFGETLKLLKAQ
jgi:zinc/manganese transport system substrate-binding protein